jgi:ribose 5-phosphate isomerase A
MTAQAPYAAAGAVDDPAVRAAALRALELIEDGARVGLGSGRAAAAFLDVLGARAKQGLRVFGVPTSAASEHRARELGIPLIDLDERVQLDLTVDGADEVAPNLDLVKGRGGALVRERIVASASRRQIIVVGREKLVDALGSRGPVPVEVIPFGVGPVLRAVKALGLAPRIRRHPALGTPALTQNGNLTLDCSLGQPLRGERAARDLERALLGLTGVVDTGLFLGTADRVLVGHPDGHVEELRAGHP